MYGHVSVWVSVGWGGVRGRLHLRMEGKMVRGQMEKRWKERGEREKEKERERG